MRVAGSDGPDSCSGLPVRRYDAPELFAELGPGFAEVGHGRTVHVTPSGATQPMTWIAARAAPDAPAPTGS